MTDVNEIRIIGFDETRPPMVRKENYIDLYFALSRKPPEEWCDDFNRLARQLNPSPKIKSEIGEFVDSYVNDMGLIPAHFSEIKQLIVECNTQFLEKTRLREIKLAEQNGKLQGIGDEQKRLNEIVATLEFEN